MSLILRSTFLFANFYPSVINFFQRYTNFSRMQTSIRMFFKAKEPASPAIAAPPMDDRENQPDDKAEKTASLNSNKRPAKDDDGDEPLETPSKRQAAAADNAQNDKPSARPVLSHDDKVKSDNKTANDTPSKSKDLKLSLPTSPLMDVNALIRMKISGGAHALHENIGVSWFRALQSEFDKPYFKKLSAFIKSERSSKVIFPPANKVYTWTHHHEFKNTRVIILGQDPYHGPNQAHGLSFSVQKGVRIPPSLVNIYKELENDISGFKAPDYGDLTGWAKQGVLMLNTCLTVEQGKAYSHQNKGWETFIDAVISCICKSSPNKIVFLLWGRPAQRKASIIDKRHKIFTAAHPSPLSAHNGFFGCAHFSQTNTFLRSQGLPEIDWNAL